MAGVILLPGDAGWSASSSTFSWIVERIASDAEPSLARELRVIIDNHLGVLDLEDLTPSDLREFRALLRRLPQITREQLPGVEYREAMARRVEELVGLVETSFESPVVEG